jgi:hypothetical protein
MSLTDPKPKNKPVPVGDLRKEAARTAPQPGAGANLHENQKKKKRTAGQTVYPKHASITDGK